MHFYLQLYILYWIISSILIYFVYNHIQSFVPSINNNFMGILDMRYGI
jgi:hypothetical protein